MWLIVSQVSSHCSQFGEDLTFIFHRRWLVGRILKNIEPCFEPLKSREKSRLLVSETLHFGFPIDALYQFSLLVEADVDCHRLT